MVIRWARKRFPDGSVIRTSTRESWTYAERDGHEVEIQVDFVRSGRHPAYVTYSRNLSTWDTPSGEPISDQKKAEIMGKFQDYFGQGNLGIE
jgi:hypothetical protein